MKPEWFAGRLRELREQAGLSRQQLADRAGMKSEAGIRNLEQGIRRPSWDTVLALCQALGVSCDAFTRPPGELPPPRVGRPRKAADAPGSPQDDADAQVSPSAASPARARRRRTGASDKGKKR